MTKKINVIGYGQTNIQILACPTIIRKFKTSDFIFWLHSHFYVNKKTEKQKQTKRQRLGLHFAVAAKTMFVMKTCGKARVRGIYTGQDDQGSKGSNQSCISKLNGIIRGKWGRILNCLFTGKDWIQIQLELKIEIFTYHVLQMFLAFRFSPFCFNRIH